MNQRNWRAGIEDLCSQTQISVAQLPKVDDDPRRENS
jgi:hypothetical protein